MGNVGISLCDICGKRTIKLIGDLRLSCKFEPTKRQPFTSNRTLRSWKCCPTCCKKLSAIETRGNAIKEDIERMLDEYSGNREKKIIKKKNKLIELTQ